MLNYEIIKIMPLDKLGISENDCMLIFDAINNMEYLYPQQPIDVQNLGNTSKISGISIRLTIEHLISIKKLQVTYIPYHRSCNKPIGLMELEIEDIKNNIDDEQYFCNSCLKTIDSYDKIYLSSRYWHNSINLTTILNN